MMQAVRIHPSESQPYSPTNPAPVTSLHLDDVPMPKVSKSGELLVRIKASTVIRDTLTWPEMLAEEYLVPGHDFSGIVESTFDEETSFKPGDEVFGMIDAARGGAWAEYAIVQSDEAALKPKHFGWEEAASVPLSALTAWQALFRKAKIQPPSIVDGGKSESTPENQLKVLITGAAGGVGVYLIQFAALAGCHVTGGNSSNQRNAAFLQSLGANEVIEYPNLDETKPFDVVVDTVGGAVLQDCWRYVAGNGVLVTVDSGSWNFVEEHRKLKVARDDINALFFIVEPASKDLSRISKTLGQGHVQSFVSAVLPLKDIQQAYEAAHDRSTGRGKVILTP